MIPAEVEEVWWPGAGGVEDWVPVFISSHLLPSADSGSGAAPAAAAMPGPEEGSG